MARARAKPDFLAGVVLWDSGRQVRAIELRVESDNLYALQPRRKNCSKLSYHQSGQLHFKVGSSEPIAPFVDLPPRFLKEHACPLDHRRRQLFSISLENAPTLLQYTGQAYDRMIELRLPKIDALLVLQLYLGRSSGQCFTYESDGYVEATITERSFSGAGYEFCIRLAALSSESVYRRFLDEKISAAWREAAADLSIRVIAPFSLATSAGDSVVYEAYLPDFGGPKGIVVGFVDRDDGDMRKLGGYGSSDLSGAYRRYDRKLFIETLNDWRWYGEKDGQPSWYSGKRWA